MGVPLVTFARQFLISKEKLAASLKTPILVWEAPTLRTKEDRESWLPTDAGHQMNRPAKGEAVAFLVEKQPGRSNAFAMGITVGRIESNDIILDDVSVSRFHAFFQRDEKKGEWTVSDADSRNGTWVNEVQVKKNEHVVVRDGDAVRLGEVAVRFFLPNGFIHFLEHMGSTTL